MSNERQASSRVLTTFHPSKASLSSSSSTAAFLLNSLLASLNLSCSLRFVSSLALTQPSVYMTIWIFCKFAIASSTPSYDLAISVAKSTLPVILR